MDLRIMALTGRAAWLRRLFLGLAMAMLEWPPTGGVEAGSSRAGQQLVYYSRGEEP
jgi:hypothetical protein